MRFRLTDDEKPNNSSHDSCDSAQQTRGDGEAESIVLPRGRGVSERTFEKRL